MPADAVACPRYYVLKMGPKPDMSPGIARFADKFVWIVQMAASRLMTTVDAGVSSNQRGEVIVQVSHD